MDSSTEGLSPVNYVSLCSGGGGLDAGLSIALPNARAIGYVENEITAAYVLAKAIEGGWLDPAPVWSDLKTIDTTPWRGLVDGIIGGYPCQPFSYAGKRQGVDDPRHLWPYIHELILDLQPSFCFFENVEGHLNKGYFDVVRPELESAGYRVKEGLFTSREVGAPHRRRRLFILAVLANTGHGAGGSELLIERDQQGEEPWSSGQEGHRGGVAHATGLLLPSKSYAWSGSAGHRGEGMGDAYGERWGQAERWKPEGGRPSPSVTSVEDAKLARLERREREELAGQRARRPYADVSRSSSAFPPGPTDHAGWRGFLEQRPGLEPAIRRGSDGVAHRPDRLHVLGNGVNPLQAALAFTTLATEMREAGWL